MDCSTDSFPQFYGVRQLRHNDQAVADVFSTAPKTSSPRKDTESQTASSTSTNAYTVKVVAIAAVSATEHGRDHPAHASDPNH